MMAPAQTLPDNIDLKKYGTNLTTDELIQFIKYLNAYNHKDSSGLDSNSSDECEDYCRGDFYQGLRVYNGLHGYVALVVSGDGGV